MSTPVTEMNHAIAMCGDAPTAAPYESLPGRCFARTMSSAVVFAVTEGWPTRINGVEPISVMGAKSLAVSYGRSWRSVGLAAKLLATEAIV
jgi:hypothetical protein